MLLAPAPHACALANAKDADRVCIVIKIATQALRGICRLYACRHMQRLREGGREGGRKEGREGGRERWKEGREEGKEDLK